MHCRGYCYQLLSNWLHYWLHPVSLHLSFNIYSYCIAVRYRNYNKKTGIDEQKGVSLFKRNSSALRNYGKYSKPPNCLSFFYKNIKNYWFSSSGCFANMIIYSEIMPMYQLFSKTIFLLKRETPFCSTPAWQESMFFLFFFVNLGR